MLTTIRSVPSDQTCFQGELSTPLLNPSPASTTDLSQAATSDHLERTPSAELALHNIQIDTTRKQYFGSLVAETARLNMR